MVVKNEGVQEGEGLFEMDDRGSASHQSAYSQVKHTFVVWFCRFG